MQAIDVVLTPRLQLRRLTEEALDEVTRMHLDPRVMATLGGVRSPDVTREWLGRHLEHWRQHGYGLWLAYERETSRFAGRGGVCHIAVEGRDEIEVAYAFRAEFWGRGLATELARESIRVAFEVLNLPELVCFTLTTNHASQHVMQKAGFRYERDIVWKDLPHVFYRLHRADWQSEQTTRSV